MIEENLAGFAAQRSCQDEIEHIGMTIQQMRDGIAVGASILDADMNFHLAVAAAAHNEVLQNAVQLLRNITRQWLYYKRALPYVASSALKRHETTDHAIAAHKPNAARSAIRQHLDETLQFDMEVVEKHSLR